MTIEHNPNRLIGASKELIEVEPTLETFKKYQKQDLQCSVDPGDSAVPEGAREYFNRHGYLIIKNLYNPTELYHPVPSIRGSIKYFGSKDKFVHEPEEKQVVGSVARYSHPQYKTIHTNIRLILQDILGKELYNTYYYDRYYFAGQRLDRHSDRDACEVSVSVQVSTNSDQPWPFCIETPNGEERACTLQNGWGLLYKGCERQHWRDPLKSRYTRKRDKLKNWITKKKDDTYHHQIFFHYVLADGPRAHCAGDLSS